MTKFWLGKHLSEETKLKIGEASKGRRPSLGKHWKLSEETKQRQRLSKLGYNNPNWKGDDVGDTALHLWITDHFIKPKFCEICGIKPGYDWANMGMYNRERNNWKYMCRKCHMESDGRLESLVQFQFRRQ